MVSVLAAAPKERMRLGVSTYSLFSILPNCKFFPFFYSSFILHKRIFFPVNSHLLSPQILLFPLYFYSYTSLRYIANRKNANKYSGNLLERPTLLTKRWTTAGPTRQRLPPDETFIEEAHIVDEDVI